MRRSEKRPSYSATGYAVSPEFQPAQAVQHDRLGTGVVMVVQDGFARVFFRDNGEQLVPLHALIPRLSPDEEMVTTPRAATAQALRRLRLALESHALPLLDDAASLTAAKVDLLPHQLVLTHRIASTWPRRFLIADDVGLGKTIETALVLRELASRGELQRALMVVPAGLVENWRRELNDVFQLQFEVFGSDGDVTDRRSNALARHDRLIVSIDTLKRPRRMELLAQAPSWDLVVFDEAHHLTATRSGNSVRKTDNYRLAELLRDHCRDLLLLSATPHQGDHFRFLQLIRLLHPTLYRDTAEMLEYRYRLNSVVIRRTKADACRTDGSPLFARRQVNTLSFGLSEAEETFYEALSDYVREGYDLAAARGGKARALGFVMTVFQKIAASSFAAVRQTLERRLLSLTLHEAIVRDAAMDVQGRDMLLREAREMLIAMHNIEESRIGRAEAERLLADARLQQMKKLRLADMDGTEDEHGADTQEDAAARLVEFALPEERQRIRQLLDLAPVSAETKTQELLWGIEQLWEENPHEKIIIFTTYLGSVNGLKTAIEERFPGTGVDVLKGGDHKAKVAAERRFRRPDGPLVLICTAAGREGINLQFARVLFNHDLPWNPMDLEQRIGRIHRYGQNDTAQIYNLVAADTIEGRVFLLLEEKIRDVAAALGKVDERGEVTEDLRGQILGQLGERLQFSQLYQEALRDPRLQRTEQELDVALSNARQARDVVGQLFQDLEPFRLEEYREVDTLDSMARLRAFVEAAIQERGGTTTPVTDTKFKAQISGALSVVFTTDRNEALADDQLQLLGLEEPRVAELLARAATLPAAERALIVQGVKDRVYTVWEVGIQEAAGRGTRQLLEVTLDGNGRIACRPYTTNVFTQLLPFKNDAAGSHLDRQQLVREMMPTTIRSYLTQIGALRTGASYSILLLAWLEALTE